MPENPEQSGWHWIEPKFGPKAMWPAYWNASDGGYWNWRTDDPNDHEEYAKFMRDGSWKYRGPVLLPAEVAAREAAAKEAGMREAAGIALEAATKALRQDSAVAAGGAIAAQLDILAAIPAKDRTP